MHEVGILRRDERTRKNRLWTHSHFLRISISLAIEKLIGQHVQSKIACTMVLLILCVCVNASTQCLFHKVPLNELENSSNTTKCLLMSSY